MAEDVCAQQNARINSTFIALNPTYRDLHLGFFIWEVTLSLYCLLVWFRFKSKFERTRVRSSSLVIMAASGAIVVSTASHLSIYILEFPCWLLMQLLALSVPLVAGPVLTRMIFFFYLSKFSEESAAISLAKNEFDIPENVSKRGVCSSFVRIFFHSNRTLLCGEDTNNESLELQHYNLLAFRYMTSTIGVFSTTSLMTIPLGIIGIIVIVSDPTLILCFGCAFNVYMQYAMLVMSLFLTLWGFIVLYRIRNFKNSWGFRSETFYSFLSIVAAIIFFVLETFLESGAGVSGSFFSFGFLVSEFICLSLLEQSIVQVYHGYKDSLLSVTDDRPDFVATMCRFLSSIILGRVLSKSSPLKAKRTESIVGFSSGITLDTVLADENLSKAFEQHLQEEFGLESLLFIRDVQAWKSKFYDISANTRRARAKRIVTTYINTNGVLAINIPDGMQKKIKTDMDLNDTDVDEHIFDDSIKELRQLLNIGAVARFVHTKRFQDMNTSATIAVL